MVCSIFLEQPKLIAIWSVAFGLNIAAVAILTFVVSRSKDKPVASNEVIDIQARTKSKNARDKDLTDKFVNDILEYCRSIGLNPSISTESGTCMIVNIRADNVIEDLIPLAFPNQDKLTTKNYNMYLEYIKEQIDTEKLRLK